MERFSAPCLNFVEWVSDWWAWVRWGASMLKTWRFDIPRAKLVTVADAFVEPAKKVAANLYVDTVYSDFSGLIDDKRVEAIAIAVPPYLKKDMIVKAARAGKHVFVEKPMTLSSKDADEIIRETDAAGVKIQVGYQRRFDHSFRRAETAIREGKIGKILMMSSHTRDPPGLSPNYYLDFAKSGGIMADTCSHDFDVIRWLSGTGGHEGVRRRGNPGVP